MLLSVYHFQPNLGSMGTEGGNVQRVSGAVGALHRHRHMASIMPSLSSLSTYLQMSSRFCPPVPSTRHPSTSPSQGLVTESSQPGSTDADADAEPGRAV